MLKNYHIVKKQLLKQKTNIINVANYLLQNKEIKRSDFVKRVKLN